MLPASLVEAVSEVLALIALVAVAAHYGPMGTEESKLTLLFAGACFALPALAKRLRVAVLWHVRQVFGNRLGAAIASCAAE